MLPVTPEPSINHQPNPWDMAGREGRDVAKHLFGDRIDHLAAFQSLETSLEGEPCGVLRLCDRNFRISYSGPLDGIVQSLNRSVWIQQFPWLVSTSLSARDLAVLTREITARPPHRIINIPKNQAVPVQINSVSYLLWKRDYLNTINFEIHGERFSIASVIEELKRLHLTVQSP